MRSVAKEAAEKAVVRERRIVLQINFGFHQLLNWI